jgi:hypothetical protein
MQDVDRTQMETGLNPYAEALFESETGDSGQYGLPLHESSEELFYEPIGELPFSEAEEMDLAAELLGIQSEQELDLFFGNLFKKIAGAIGKVIKSPVGRVLGGVLKKVAKTALPVAGRVVGGMFGGPAGSMIGGQLGSAAGRIFGLELEGMAPEEAEFEVARRFVRFAGASIKNAALAPPDPMDPQRVAKMAIAQAARRVAPGLVATLNLTTPSSRLGGPILGTGPRSGAWRRHGHKIILYGV